MAKTNDKASEATDNLALWERRCTTDPRMLKEVQIGARHFTSVRPYSQLRAATEEWGPYGWRWGLREIRYAYIGAADDPRICEATAVFFYPSPDGTEVHFELADEIKIWWTKHEMDSKSGERWDVRMEAEEYHKKLRTSLQSKALSLLGFNADVFLGEHDQAQRHRSTEAQSGDGAGHRTSGGSGWSASEKQLTRLRAIAANFGYDEAAIHELIGKNGLKSTKELNRQQYDRLCGDAETGQVGYFERHPKGTGDQSSSGTGDDPEPDPPPPDFDEPRPPDDLDIPF